MVTTKQHFSIFKKEFLKWVEVWGLKDFHYTFAHDDTEMSYAQIEPVMTGRRFDVTLSTEIPDDEFKSRTANEFMKHLAFHECAECLLCGVRSMAMERKFDPEELDREVHGIINRLQNAIQFKNEIGT